MAQELLMAAEWGRNVWDFVGNNAANIIALTAVVFTAYQAWLTRRHNRLSVRPHLLTHFSTHTNYSEPAYYYSLELRNYGLGPAVVNSWGVLLDGEEKELPTSKDVDKLIKGLVPNFLSLSTRFLGKAEVMRANDSEIILALKLPLMNAAEQTAFEKQLDRLALVVDYSSMYGEKCKPLDTRE